MSNFCLGVCPLHAGISGSTAKRSADGEGRVSGPHAGPPEAKRAGRGSWHTPPSSLSFCTWMNRNGLIIIFGSCHTLPVGPCTPLYGFYGDLFVFFLIIISTPMDSLGNPGTRTLTTRCLHPRGPQPGLYLPRPATGGGPFPASREAFSLCF